MKTGSARLLSLLAALTALALLASGCAAGKQEFKVGGLYSLEDGEGAFRVVKILALDEEAVHIAIYANRFPTRPTKVDPGSLYLGGVDEDDNNIGIMHLPLARDSFARDRPVFISQTSVTEEELEGYRMWQEAGAEVFR